MLKILMASSEASPFAKTGGLADVLGSLPSALKQQGTDVRVIMPKYGTMDAGLRSNLRHLCYFYIRMNWRNIYCGVEQAEYNGITYYFVDNEFYFKRSGFYGYEDDGERFAFFCHAVLEVLPHISFYPDVLHCHDWQAGMIPVLLETDYRGLEKYRGIKTMFTIHNLKYQGVYGIDQFKDWFGLGDEFFTSDKLEFYHNASFLKGGLVYSNLLTTVSPTYAEEIKSPYFGERMDGLLKARRKELYGILNGIDNSEFNPDHDQFIYQTYSTHDLGGKAVNKAALRQELNLQDDTEIPLIGLISRLVDQKGLDLIACVLEEILSEDLQLVILGAGDAKYEGLLKETAVRHPGKMSVNLKFDNDLAHRIYAASDLFLMPSQFEPCGLGQMISLRYGTLPIVRETGGLKDTVISYNELTGEGNGFSFINYNAHDMLHTIRRALCFYRQKMIWNKLQEAAMCCDNSWFGSADKYLELYRTLKENYSEEKD